MKIKNISTKVLLIGGVLINPNQIVSDSDFGTGFSYSDYESEFINAYNKGQIIFLDVNNKEITNMNTILDIINSTSNSSDSGDGDSSVNSIAINKENFYYDYKTINMKYNEIKDIKFVGYLKTLDFIVDKGLIDVQCINPLMNKIEIFESNHYSFDSDYKLKDPTIRLTAKTDGTAKIYLDGIFYSTTKTKDQYLNEIYSYDYFPNAPILPENKLVFKTNFFKLLKYSYFLDTIGNKQGQIFNGSTLRNFNKFEDGSYVKFSNMLDFKDNNFTFCLWFNLEKDYENKQYLFYDHYNLECYVQNNAIRLRIGTHYLPLIALKDSNIGNWALISISKNNNIYNIYINSELVQTIDYNVNFRNSGKMYFGSSGNYGIRSGYLGECLIYNYHLSKGMIKYIYANNCPTLQVQTNLIPGSVKNIFSYNSSLAFNSAYEFSIVEKENAKTQNLILSTNESTMKGNCSKLTVITGKIHIPQDNKYTFSMKTDAKYAFIIDNKDVLVNDSNTIYIEEGYYNFKLTLIGESTYELITSSNSSTPIQIPLIEDIDNNTIKPVLLIDADKSIGDGMTFNNIVNKYVKSIGKIINLPKTLSNIFTCTVNFKVYEDNALIFQIGKDIWNPTIGLKLSDGTLECDFHWSTMTAGVTKTKWHNVILTSNGSTLFGYLDGQSMGQVDVDVHSLETNSPLYFNAFCDGTQPEWAIGNFDINNFKWYTKYSNESDVLSLYNASNIKDK